MSKYIDSDKLIAEIEKRMETHRKASADGYIIDPNRLDEDEYILSFINSLQQEQPEVDLEKEAKRWRHQHFDGKRDEEYNGEYLERTSQFELARHFYELGLNARKEE